MATETIGTAQRARHRTLPLSGVIDARQEAVSPDGSTAPYAWVEWTHKRGELLPDELRAHLPAFIAVAELEMAR